ncbi:lysophospholipid acyltransferase family protein [Heliophilum fasciatum]|uniref:1-acyl-sn-glycerol-3-phosphate acyltransferase n=1 Tax=Heliophilum fasciatum TaxID=35700 RepID=A0A4R2RLJ6_9FIRM|nr:lysophospholipid acyltransferase family protein [Heliophilum fasciatum]MCW2278302.1 1-acyl-sn-glycerol-3-phosphate acyltransferase [Heliophilum fasciatum]TCP63824.1 1-acyl-sn-glycerol-3-phosphate acyltransferase [Heliophilum fasciatum]
MLDRVQTAEAVRKSGLYLFLHRWISAGFANACRWQVHGWEHVPVQGPVILASNHLSNWDPVVLACAVRRPVHFMAKKELFAIPLIGSLIGDLGAFAVDRQSTGRQALKASVAILEKGGVIGVFPEGTRSKTGALGEAKAGTALIALMAKTPIVPVGLYNTGRIFSGGRFQSFAVEIGSPLPMDMTEGKKNTSQAAQQLTEQMMTAIEQLVEQGRQRLS